MGVDGNICGVVACWWGLELAGFSFCRWFRWCNIGPNSQIRPTHRCITPCYSLTLILIRFRWLYLNECDRKIDVVSFDSCLLFNVIVSVFDKVISYVMIFLKQGIDYSSFSLIQLLISAVLKLLWSNIQNTYLSHLLEDREAYTQVWAILRSYHNAYPILSRLIVKND